MLLTSLAVSGSGTLAASSFLDVVGNNVANSSTPGFKTSQVSFQDLLSIGTKPGGSVTATTTVPQGTQIGSGAIVSSITPLITQGQITPTGQQFDVAITGQGFFAVNRPDGTVGYTRAGSFTANANGQLVTADGSVLAGNVVVPTNASSVSIAADGTVTAVTPAGTVPIGNITLTQFQNPDGLTQVGDTTFAASPASGVATTSTPGTNGAGTLEQGSLEQSNVDLPTELINLIIAQNAFQFNTNALNIENQMLQTTTQLIT